MNISYGTEWTVAIGNSRNWVMAVFP